MYFGDIGHNSKELIGYFERNGGTSCPVDANPAEWMLQVIGGARGTSTHLDWFKIWRESHEYNMIQNELRNSKKVIRVKGLPATSKMVESKAIASLRHHLPCNYERTSSASFSSTGVCLSTSTPKPNSVPLLPFLRALSFFAPQIQYKASKIRCLPFFSH